MTQHNNNIFAYITPDAKAVSVSGEVMRAVSDQIAIPAGYRIDVAGESEQQAEADQIKSKKRVEDHGEVFTPSTTVRSMLDLVKEESERIEIGS